MEGIQKICHHDISALSAQSEIRLRTRGIFDSGRGHPSFPCSCPVFQRSWVGVEGTLSAHDWSFGGRECRAILWCGRPSSLGSGNGG